MDAPMLLSSPSPTPSPEKPDTPSSNEFPSHISTKLTTSDDLLLYITNMQQEMNAKFQVVQRAVSVKREVKAGTPTNQVYTNGGTGRDKINKIADYEAAIGQLTRERDEWKKKFDENEKSIQGKETQIKKLQMRYEEKLHVEYNLLEQCRYELVVKENKIQELETKVGELSEDCVRHERMFKSLVKNRGDFREESEKREKELKANIRAFHQKVVSLESKLRRQNRKLLSNGECTSPFSRLGRSDNDKATIVVPIHFSVREEYVGAILELCWEKQKIEQCEWVDWYRERQFDMDADEEKEAELEVSYEEECAGEVNESDYNDSEEETEEEEEFWNSPAQNYNPPSPVFEVSSCCFGVTTRSRRHYWTYRCWSP